MSTDPNPPAPTYPAGGPQPPGTPPTGPKPQPVPAIKSVVLLAGDMDAGSTNYYRPDYVIFSPDTEPTQTLSTSQIWGGK